MTRVDPSIRANVVPYFISWYRFIHPGETIYAPYTDSSFHIRSDKGEIKPDILNESRGIAWDAKTGKRVEMESQIIVPGFLKVVLETSGPGWPEAVTIGDAATRLARDLEGTGYKPGTLAVDEPLQNYMQANSFDESGVASVFFSDGTVMLVRVPTEYTSAKGKKTTAISGIIAYCLLKTAVVPSPNATPQVISVSEYGERFN